MSAAAVCQLLLLAYHQATTLVDFHPFNGARSYTRNQKLAEAGSNAVLMSLAPIGYAFHVSALMTFGAWYYFVLFAVELTLWWVPYLSEPAGIWRRAYNLALSLATSNFEPGDTLAHWKAIHARIHRGTFTVLPERGDRPVPNVEHMVLHAMTLATAFVTLRAYLAFPGLLRAGTQATALAIPHAVLAFPWILRAATQATALVVPHAYLAFPL